MTSSPDIAEVDPFHAISIGRLAYDLAEQGRDVVHMEYGQPSTGAPVEAIAAAHKALDSDPGGYWESTALKQRIARHYDEAYGVLVDEEQVILTCGASPALVLALSCLFRPGARVVMVASNWKITLQDLADNKSIKYGISQESASLWLHYG